MEALKKLPIGIQAFENLREDGYLYVDKTALVYQLANDGQCYFLSRPRRFGKSLLLSTLHAYFSGKSRLFDGLAIASLESDWTEYPVLHIDLNSIKKGDPGALNSLLNDTLCCWEETYGSRQSEDTFSLRFKGVIRRACALTGRRVVILVDEYDKPILQTIDNEPLQEEFRNTLKDFYGVLKGENCNIRFALLTGVTKFSKVSVFSDMNNLKDISMDERYATICGITDSEIDSGLSAYVERLALKNDIPTPQAREELRTRYDGYHFCENTPGVYNPFSLLNTFDQNRFSNYWFETGTPSYLVYLLQRHHYRLEKLTRAEATEDELKSIDPQSKDPIPVIYQSGYLTLKSYNPRFRTYNLGFPNKEVEDGFLNYLLPYYTPIPQSETAFNIRNFVEEVEAGRVDDFFRRLSSLFADTPYELVKDLENHYQNVLFIVSKLMGFYVKAEYHTSEGRIDLVIQTSRYLYVMEFKLNGSAEEALAQINDKNYALPFAADGRQIIKIGVNFSSTTRNIDRWLTIFN